MESPHSLHLPPATCSLIGTTNHLMPTSKRWAVHLMYPLLSSSPVPQSKCFCSFNIS